MQALSQLSYTPKILSQKITSLPTNLSLTTATIYRSAKL